MSFERRRRKSFFFRRHSRFTFNDALFCNCSIVEFVSLSLAFRSLALLFFSFPLTPRATRRPSRGPRATKEEEKMGRVAKAGGERNRTTVPTTTTTNAQQSHWGVSVPSFLPDVDLAALLRRASAGECAKESSRRVFGSGSWRRETIEKATEIRRLFSHTHFQPLPPFNKNTLFKARSTSPLPSPRTRRSWDPRSRPSVGLLRCKRLLRRRQQRRQQLEVVEVLVDEELRRQRRQRPRQLQQGSLPLCPRESQPSMQWTSRPWGTCCARSIREKTTRSEELIKSRS